MNTLIKPLSVEEFESIVDKMKDLHARKNADYSGDDYLADIRASTRLSIEPWVNCLLRIQQKMGRLENFARTNYFQVKDEKVEDTAIDIAVYSIILLMLYRNKNEKISKRDQEEHGRLKSENSGI